MGFREQRRRRHFSGPPLRGRGARRSPDGGHHGGGGERHCPPSLEPDPSGCVMPKASQPRVLAGAWHKAALASDLVSDLRGLVPLPACAAMAGRSGSPPVAGSSAARPPAVPRAAASPWGSCSEPSQSRAPGGGASSPREPRGSQPCRGEGDPRLTLDFSLKSKTNVYCYLTNFINSFAINH